jgi:hypothetical protein
MPARCLARSEPRHYTGFHFNFFGGELADSRRAGNLEVEDAACSIRDFSIYALGE